MLCLAESERNLEATTGVSQYHLTIDAIFGVIMITHRIRFDLSICFYAGQFD